MISESNLALLIEFWFPFSEIESTRKLGTWCDGIPLLEVDAIDRTTFLIAGVGYFPRDLAAFEIEFRFANRRDLCAQTIVLRLGRVVHVDRQLNSQCKNPRRLFENRPTFNSDWAVAVELSEAEPEEAG